MVLGDVPDGREVVSVVGHLRDRHAGVGAADARRGLADEHELVAVAVRQRREQDAVDDGKNRGVGADAEAERQDGSQGVAGRSQEHPHAVARVLPEIVPEGGAADVAHFLLHAIDAAEVAERRTPRLGRRHPGANPRVDLHLQMKRQLALDVVVQPAAPPHQPHGLDDTGQ